MPALPSAFRILFLSAFVVLPMPTTPPVVAQEPDAQRIASRLGIALVGIALGPQVNRFHSLPCPARGVIHYVRSGEGGLLTRFAGCDLGDGVEVHGQGRLWWPDPGPEYGAEDRFCGFMTGPGLPTCPRELRWEGDLEVHLDGSSIPRLPGVRIDDLVIADEGGSFPDDLDFRSGVMGFVSMTVTLRDSVFSITDDTLPMMVFAPAGLTTSSIPNPEGSLDALTEADLARLTWDAFDLMERWLLNETLETQRGPHSHDLDCGTLEVGVKENLAILHADWWSCEYRGLLWSGDFHMRWNEFSEQVFDFSLEGELEIGGAVPRTLIERVHWRSEQDDVRSRSLSGAIEGGGQRRPFQYLLGAEE